MTTLSNNNNNDGNTAPENMSVSELRAWLKQVEKKHQDHYHNQEVRRRSPTQNGRSLSVRGRAFGMERLKEEEDEGAVAEDENRSQQENHGVHRESPLKQFGVFTQDPKQQQHGSIPHSTMMNRVAVMQGKASQKTEASTVAPPPFHDDQYGEIVSPISSSPQSFGSLDHELATKEDSPDDLCLALSSVTMASSSSSVEVAPSEPVVTTQPMQKFATNLKKGRFHLLPAIRRLQFAKKKQQQQDHHQQQDDHDEEQQQRKRVPDDWSDFEPVDFDASMEEESSSSDKEKMGEVTARSKFWPVDDASEYLEMQSLPSFQGYWSDKDYDDDDDDNDADDDSSAATGRKTEPPRSRFTGTPMPHYSEPLDNCFPMKVTDEEDAPFSLVDAALDSVASAKGPSRPRSLSEHFLVSTKGKPTKGKGKRSKRKGKKRSPSNLSMHDATLCQNKTMTAGALDAICGKVNSPSREENSSNLETLFERGDQGTIDSWSQDSGKPSIAPDAVDPKLSELFALNAEDKVQETRQPEFTGQRSTADETREAVPMPDFESSPKEFVDTMRSSKSEIKTETPAANSTFAANMRKFGGVAGRRQPRKSRIQLRKEALAEKLGNNRHVRTVTKKTWQVSASGAYKRRTVVNYEDK